MRVALLATEIDFARPAGGAARYAIEAWKALRARGHDATLWCYGPRPAGDPPGVERLEVGRIPVLRALELSTRVNARLARDAPDVVLANYPLLARHVVGVPVVIIVHSTMRGLGNAAGWGPRGIAERLARRVLGAPHERAALAACTAAVCVNDHVAHDVVRSGAVPDDRVRVVPGGVDLTRFSPPATRQGGPPFRLLCVGRLIALKRFDLAIAALERLRARGTDATLAIAGTGPERGRLARLAARSSARGAIELLGELDGDGLATAYGRAHALVLPSRHEGLPLVALEAMASGLGVVATGFPGADALVGHGERGVLVTDDSPDGLAGALAHVVADPAAWAACGANARVWVAQHYAWSAIVDRLDEVLRRVTSPA